MNLNRMGKIIGVLALAGLSAALFLEHRARVRLTAEVTRLQEVTAQLDELRQENSRLAKLQLDAAELARLRQGQEELLRLRGEATRLQQRLAQSQKSKASSSPVDPTPVEAPPQIQRYTNSVLAQVPIRQTLVTGGWPTSEGKQTFVLVTPNIAAESTTETPRQVELQSHVVEIPDELVAAFGLNQVKADSGENNQQLVLAEEQLKTVLATLRQTEGAKVLAAPRMITLDGRQARAAIGSSQNLSGEDVHIGPTIDIVPVVSPDGSLVRMNVVAQLNQLR